MITHEGSMGTDRNPPSGTDHLSLKDLRTSSHKLINTQTTRSTHMADNQNENQQEQPVEEKKPLTPEEEREERLKKRIEELRKRDPFIYR